MKDIYKCDKIGIVLMNSCFCYEEAESNPPSACTMVLSIISYIFFRTKGATSNYQEHLLKSKSIVFERKCLRRGIESYL